MPRIQVDRNGLQFFWKHVLKQDWQWLNIVKAPKVRSLPDILTVIEIEQMIAATRNLRYRVFLLATYSMGLRLGEALSLQVGDIDGQRKQVHIRRGKGHKDRFVPLPDLTYHALRALWSKHRNPCWLFPNAVGSPERIRNATTHMDRGGAQAAMKAVVEQCGIKKSLHSLPEARLCNPSSGKWLRPSSYPGAPRSQQPHHHGAIHAFNRYFTTKCN
jgi:integrase